MKYQDFKNAIGSPYFSRQDIVLQHLPLFDYQLVEWAKKGYVKKLKRGLYIFSDRAEELLPQEIAFLLYQPSYISLESAMSYHGFIPEMVYAVTSVTTKITRTFSNHFGKYIYRSVKPEVFFGYEPRETPNGKYLMAEPEKALLDFFYLNMNSISSLDDIQEIRINYDILRKRISMKKMNRYLSSFQSPKLCSLIQNLC